jgi:transposase
MTRMELFEAIRRDHFVDQKSFRKIAQEHGVHRRDVRRAVRGEAPPTRKESERESPVLGPHEATIDRWLCEDQKRRRKQRHTAHRIWERLCAEKGFTGAESTVRRHVGRRRRELGLTVKEVYIEQDPQPGEEAQVDFGEADVFLGGVLTKVYLLLVRCCYSGRTEVMAFRRQTQQCFLEGLATALSRFGGVFEQLRFDNLAAAVKKILRGRMRKETDRFVALRSHYLFSSEFCRPGKEGAHEKGGVEGEVGR